MPARRRRGGGDDAFLRCRNYRHAWDEFNPIDLEAPWYGWRLSLRCLRCETERHDNYAYGTNQLLGRRYVYPEGYQYPKAERPSQEEFREELFTKLRAQLKANDALGEDAKVVPIRSAKKKSSGNRTAKKAPVGGRARKTNARKRTA